MGPQRGWEPFLRTARLGSVYAHAPKNRATGRLRRTFRQSIGRGRPAELHAHVICVSFLIGQATHRMSSSGQHDPCASQIAQRQSPTCTRSTHVRRHSPPAGRARRGKVRVGFRFDRCCTYMDRGELGL
ncbi:hypothetical protein PYCCODRAFT_791112 [Trametes coccinea BRFM310]|uniref:Uncharacterized protein n=1 Tax=Trametes coccinea (strain BRFM310) TaxID=1353009 RepID=A0A1Y2J158_TRAC3|nr:hypothetical protein PYCCODRAFT_791112 [Trametes coccinea BRFM310]